MTLQENILFKFYMKAAIIDTGVMFSLSDDQ